MRTARMAPAWSEILRGLKPAQDDTEEGGFDRAARALELEL